MSNEYCANCGRTCGHKSIRWVLTDKGREVLEEIRREARSGAGELGTLAVEQGPLRQPHSR